jgi:hypothetical protein
MRDKPRTPLGRTADRLRATGAQLKNMDLEAVKVKRIRQRVRMVAWIVLVIAAALLAYGLYIRGTSAVR